jgi:hypothetical protein
MNVPNRISVAEGIAALAAGLFWTGGERILVIWGYYDESGEYDGGNLLNMTIGGCFSSLGRWQVFDTEWKKVLDDEGLSFFHMTEFEAYRPPFDFVLPDGNRDKERHNRLLNSLLDIMLRHVEGFYGFGAVSMFDPASPKQTHKNLMDDCVLGAVKHAVLHITDFYKQPINLVFGKQRHFPEDGIKKYLREYEHRDPKGGIKSFTTADPKDVRPLQGADIFAYEMARAQRSGRQERYPFQRLIDGAKANGLNMSMNWGPIRGSQHGAR